MKNPSAFSFIRWFADITIGDIPLVGGKNASLGEMMRHELANGGDSASVGKLLGTLDATLRQTLQLVRDMTEKQFPPVLKAFGLHVALPSLRAISMESA